MNIVFLNQYVFYIISLLLLLFHPSHSPLTNVKRSPPIVRGRDWTVSLATRAAVSYHVIHVL